MSDPSLVVVLAEDVRHQAFVRRYLYRLGFGPHDIRFEKLPSGAGSGEQWVRLRYAQAVKAHRERCAKAKTALIVVIDADTESTVERSKRLSDALRESAVSDRFAKEQIVHFIPKRHIETWILCLNGSRVDEEKDYKRLITEPESLIRSAAQTFFDWSRPNVAVPAHCIPSIRKAIDEAERLSA